MKALLLSAGFGTRLAPLTKNIPKCLVPIEGIPLIEYWLIQLIEFGIKDIFINIHYLSDVVEKYFSDSIWNRYITLIYEGKLLGTAGTIKQNKPFFQSGSFLVAHADNLVVLDLKKFIKHHELRAKSIEITMMTFTTDSPKTCGIVVADDNGIVCEFYEKDKNYYGNIANGAIYIFEPSIINQIEKFKEPMIDISKDLIPLNLGKIQIWHNHTYLRDIGNLYSLRQANQDVVKLYKLKILRDKLIKLKKF